MRIHLFYSALSLALVAGAATASAQTVIETVRIVQPATPMIVGDQVIKQTVVRRVASGRPIYNYAGPGRVVTTRAYTRRLYNIVTTRTITRPIYDYVAPAPLVAAPVYSRPYYDAGYRRPIYDYVAPGPVVTTPVYSRHYYDGGYTRPIYDYVAPGPMVTAPIYSRPYYDAGYTRPIYDYDAAYSRSLDDTWLFR